jgi:hypothetical protein
VNIPAGRPSWELLLETTTGDAEMVVRYGTVPDFSATTTGEVYLASTGSEIEMVKVGPERYVLLPKSLESTLPPGDYYIAVVSQGADPTGTTIGTGTSSATLTSVGPLLVTQLGLASEEPIVRPISLKAGQIQAFQYDVPEDVYSLEVRWTNGSISRR